MSVGAVRGALRGVYESLKIVGAHLLEVSGFRSPSREDFRVELAGLGLLGRRFGPVEYASALEEALGVRISLEEFPDVSFALAGRELLEEGTLAEVFYGEATREALVLVRESLKMRPWPAYELAVYHELSHLAAGHPVKVRAEARGGRRRLRALPVAVARSGPRSGEAAEGRRGRGGEKVLAELARRVYEPEAKRRARWLVLAGSYPEVFEGIGADRLT